MVVVAAIDCLNSSRPGNSILEALNATADGQSGIESGIEDLKNLLHCHFDRLSSESLAVLTKAALALPDILPGLESNNASFNKDPGKIRSSTPARLSLRVLTTAALALPGLMLPAVQAADNAGIDPGHGSVKTHDNSLHSESRLSLLEGGGFSFKYGHYQEFGAPKSLFRDKRNDIRVDSLQVDGNLSLSNRLTLRAGFIQDTWSGATPLTTAPAATVKRNPNAETGASAFLDLTNGLVQFDPDKGVGTTINPSNPQTIEFVETNEIVQVMAEASPETRKQGDLRFEYDWDKATGYFGGGISKEDDYESRYVNLGGSMDFNRKSTTLNLGLSYTNSNIDATRFRFRATSVPVDPRNEPNPAFPDYSTSVHETRRDYSANLGLTQVLDQDSILNASVTYIHNWGYLSNPYKESTFFARLDPASFPGQSLLFTRYDRRPEDRDLLTVRTGIVRYIDLLNASLHFDYSFFHDSWGIDAHTFDLAWGQPLGGGWIITPNVRYYSQSAARFYNPFFGSTRAPLSFNEFQAAIRGDSSLLITPDFFTSDHRLSGFGALSGGLTLKKTFERGIGFEAGFEIYTHRGGWKLGGKGTGRFADFDFWQAFAGLNVDLAAFGKAVATSGHGGHGGHSGNAPAGILFSHVLENAGEFMVGYRYMYGRRAGDTLAGSRPAGDLFIVNNGCEVRACQLTAETMNMHMLNIMYAPTDWMNLMLMPQFMDMNMSLRQLAGAPPPAADANGGHFHTAGSAGHATSGVGDTGLFSMFRLFRSPDHQLLLGLGVTAPTGAVNITIEGMEVNRNDPHFGQPLLIHYGMQLGSGTWDFVPSLTYLGQLDQWAWGAQLNSVVRLQDKNSSGFAFGDEFQATAWGSYSPLDWLSMSLRGIYTVQGSVRGRYNGASPNSAPVDFPANYGGRFWDLGMGLNATLPSGPLAGNSIGFEWVQPLVTDVNGFQLDREGSLFLNWSVTF